MYFITREVSNRAVTYCLILHICIMIVLIIATWRQQGVNSKLGFGKKAQRIFFPICTWLMLFSISTPVELYLNNSDDFSLSFWTFFSKLVVVSIVVLCFFVILVYQKEFEISIYLAINNKIILDFKTELQEYLQKDGEVNITYELAKFEGPPHRRKFYLNVYVCFTHR